jgi:hypothetical protein
MSVVLSVKIGSGKGGRSTWSPSSSAAPAGDAAVKSAPAAATPTTSSRARQPQVIERLLAGSVP